MYPRIEDAGHYSPFHTIPFFVGAFCPSREARGFPFSEGLSDALAKPPIDKAIESYQQPTHKSPAPEWPAGAQPVP